MLKRKSERISPNLILFTQLKLQLAVIVCSESGEVLFLLYNKFDSVDNLKY
jgi:hypothetical protein